MPPSDERSPVCIHSPPRAAGGSDDSGVDLYDPETYRRKFEVYGEIVFITVVLKNGSLMKVGWWGRGRRRKKFRERCRRWWGPAQDSVLVRGFW